MTDDNLPPAGGRKHLRRRGIPPITPSARAAAPAVVLLHNLDPSWSAADTRGVLNAVRQVAAALAAEGHRVYEAPVTGVDLAGVLAPFDPADHIVFNWCEELPGVARSDVQVAGLLEDLGYTYTGSPPETLTFSWDKAAVKGRLSASGVPTPMGKVVDTESLAGWSGFPAIVKPVFEHCSVGVDRNAVVLDEAALRARVAYVRETFSQPAIVEDFIDGREFHVTLWGNGRVEMLPPAEMDFSAFSDVRDRLCTYDAKFTPGSRHYEEIELRIPARMSASELALLRKTSIAAYRQLNCRDYARIDLRLQKGVFYVLDVNPNADISPDTSLAYAAEAAGMGYAAFVSRLVNLAGLRHSGRPGRRVRP